jgi:hypothetical protein
VRRSDVPAEDASVEQAIARVLETEAAARAEVARCEAEAAGRIDRAREAARAVGERAERRIGRIRERFEQQIAAEVAALDREVADLDASYALDSQDRTLVARAVAVLAAKMTGDAR